MDLNEAQTRARQSAGDIVQFYEQYLPKIFGSPQKRSSVHSLVRPRCKSDVLRQVLEDFFLNRTLSDVTTDVCVTSVALQTGKPRFYKSGYLARNQGRIDEKLSDIAL